MFIFSVETIIGTILIALLIFFKSYWAITDWWKQRNCKHEKHYEDMACDAICYNCKKNLGFIGKWEKGKS